MQLQGRGRVADENLSTKRLRRIMGLSVGVRLFFLVVTLRMWRTYAYRDRDNSSGCGSDDLPLLRTPYRHRIVHFLRRSFDHADHCTTSSRGGATIVGENEGSIERPPPGHSPTYCEAPLSGSTEYAA